MQLMLTFLILGLAVFGMAVGVIFTGKSINNTCSGTGSCTVCRNDSGNCQDQSDHLTA